MEYCEATVSIIENRRQGKKKKENIHENLMKEMNE